MKVLLVHPHLTNLGGAEIVVLKLAVSLSEQGIDNSILTLSLPDEIRKKYSQVDFLLPPEQYLCKPKSVGFRNATRVINEVVLLAKLIRKYKEKYDVINVHNFPAHWGVFFSRIDKPVVWTCNETPDIWHNPNPSFAIRLLRNGGVIFDKTVVAKSIDLICSADKINAQKVIARYGRNPEIVPYGIDYDFFNKANGDNSLLVKYGLQDRFIVLQVGLITPEKNQLASIKAVEILRKDIPNIKLVLAGRVIGAYIDILKRYVSDNKLEDYVAFTGNLDKDTLRNLYCLSKIVIFPVKTQGGWLAPFEALSCGKPIVVSPSMGAADLIKEKKLGLVNSDLVTGIREICSNEKGSIEMAKKAKEWVGSNLTYNINAKRMIELYQKTLNKQ